MGWTGLEFIFTPLSPPCRAVWMCIKAVGVDVDMRKIDMYNKAEHKQPWFVKMNPQHTVPTINDNDFVLWESRAIMAYLVNKYGKEDSLYPNDPEKRATVDRLLYFDIGTLYKSVLEYFQPILFCGLPGDPVKANALKQSLEYLDLFLQDVPYAAGDQLTIADFALLASVTHLDGLDFPYKGYANIFRWVQKLKKELPYYKECNDDGLAQFAKWAKARQAFCLASAKKTSK